MQTSSLYNLTTNLQILDTFSMHVKTQYVHVNKFQIKAFHFNLHFEIIIITYVSNSE